MVYRGMRHILSFSIMYICIYNKNKHNQLRSRQLNRMGHDIPRIRGGEIFNLWANGENPNVYEKTHQAVHYLSCLFLQSFISARMWLSELLHGMGRVWAKKFEMGRDPFLKIVFWLPWQGKCPKTYAILPYTHILHLLTQGSLGVVFTSTILLVVCSSFTIWAPRRFYHYHSPTLGLP